MKAQLEGKVKITAVHDSDLDFFLKKLGLWEKMQSGQLKCSFCDCLLNTKNFGGVFKENSEVKPFCQKTECYLEVLRHKNAVK
jgi:hypothetical protein